MIFIHQNIIQYQQHGKMNIQEDDETITIEDFLSYFFPGGKLIESFYILIPVTVGYILKYLQFYLIRSISILMEHFIYFYSIFFYLINRFLFVTRVSNKSWKTNLVSYFYLMVMIIVSLQVICFGILLLINKIYVTCFNE